MTPLYTFLSHKKLVSSNLSFLETMRYKGELLAKEKFFGNLRDWSFKFEMQAFEIEANEYHDRCVMASKNLEDNFKIETIRNKSSILVDLVLNQYRQAFSLIKKHELEKCSRYSKYELGR